jgi:hypothetical protein
MGLRHGRLSLAASFTGALLILGDVYLAGRYGWQGGFVAAATVAVAVVAYLAWRASSATDVPRRRREDSFVRLVLPLLAAAVAGLVVYVIGATDPVAPALIVAAPVVYVLLVHVGPRVARRARSFRVAAGVLTFAIASVAGVYLLAPAIYADWALVDDHFIVRYQTPGSQLTLADVPRRAISDTSLGNQDERRFTPRFIPSYYILQFYEKWLWGPSPVGWHAMRMAMFIVVVTLGWLMLARGVGWVAAGLLVAWIVALPFWPDVWCKLGVTETYTATGAALCGWGLLAAWDARRSRRPISRFRKMWPWALVLAGGLLAIGSKENFLVLLAPVWLTVTLLWWRGRRPITGSVVAIALTLFASLIVYQTFHILHSLGRDHYGNDVSGAHRAHVLAEGLAAISRHVQWIDLVVAVIGLVVVAAFVVRGRSLVRRVWTIEATAFGVVAACGALWLSQYVFYDGKWPAGMRYDFPGVLAVPLAIAAAAAFGLTLLRTLGWDRRIVRAVRGGLVVGLLLVVASRDLSTLRQGALTTVENNYAFSLCLDTLAEKAKANPNRPILFITWRPWDFEPAHSYRQFLVYRGVSNPLYMTLLGFSPELFPAASPDRRLAQELATMSREGVRGFRPIGELRSPEDAISFLMTTEPATLFRFDAIAPATQPK